MQQKYYPSNVAVGLVLASFSRLSSENPASNVPYQWYARAALNLRFVELYGRSKRMLSGTL